MVKKRDLRAEVMQVILFLCSAKLQIYSMQDLARPGKHSWPILTRELILASGHR